MSKEIGQELQPPPDFIILGASNKELLYAATLNCLDLEREGQNDEQKNGTAG